MALESVVFEDGEWRRLVDVAGELKVALVDGVALDVLDDGSGRRLIPMLCIVAAGLTGNFAMSARVKGENSPATTAPKEM